MAFNGKRCKGCNNCNLVQKLLKLKSMTTKPCYIKVGEKRG
jgi:hypothetical protein